MPELPEVETVCRGMREEMLNKQVTSFWKSSKNLRFPLHLDEINHIICQKITDIKRRGKCLIITFDKGDHIIIHLGMTGQISFSSQEKEYKKHDHFRIYFSDKFYMNFNDTRRFGYVEYVERGMLAHNKHLKSLAPEPLTEDFNSEYLFTLSKTSDKAIKEFIMDNTKVVGVGNIYASESLFRSNIHPEIRSKNITRHQIDKLVTEIKNVLQEAINAGGSSINDYVKANGELGYFQAKFNTYNRENLPCKICNKNICKIVQQGRSTYFCPSCQKRGRK